MLLRVVLLLLLSAAGWCQSGGNQTVPEKNAPAALHVDFQRALELARRQNPEWRALASGPQAAAGDLLQAGMTPNPTLSLRSSLELPFTLESAGLSLSQEFEMGGKRDARLALAQSRQRVAELRARDGERKLRQELRQELVETLYFQNLSAVRGELVKLVDDTLSLTRQRLKIGDVAGLDVIQLETEQARRRANWQDSLGQLRARQAALGRLLGEPANVPLWVDGQLAANRVLPPLEELQKLASNRPDLLAAQSESEAGARDIELQEARGVSNLTASLGITRERLLVDGDKIFPRGAVDRIDDRAWVVGASLSLPLPINDTNEGNIEKARAQAEGARLQEQTQAQKVQAEVVRAYHEWEAARNVVDTLQESAMTKALQTLTLTNRAYELGARSLLNVMQARQEYTDLLLTRLEALRSQELALSRLEAAIGGELP